MPKIKPPCYKCEDRTQNCHAACERYKAYKEQVAEQNAVINAIKEKESAADEYTLSNKKRLRKRLNIRSKDFKGG